MKNSNFWYYNLYERSKKKTVAQCYLTYLVKKFTQPGFYCSKKFSNRKFHQELASNFKNLPSLLFIWKKNQTNLSDNYFSNFFAIKYMIIWNSLMNSLSVQHFRLIKLILVLEKLVSESDSNLRLLDYCIVEPSIYQPSYTRHINLKKKISN